MSSAVTVVPESDVQMLESLRKAHKQIASRGRQDHHCQEAVLDNS